MANTNTRTKNVKLNWISSISLQIVTAISGLIIPRIIIPTYGSSINGVVASITQFISYMTLLEAGVGSVFRASLYKPLYNGDMQRVSGIINEQKRFYRKLGFIFIVYTAVLCFIYPLIIDTGLDRKYTTTLILILSIGTFIEYFISLPYQSLIVADQMIRLVNISSSIVIICNIIATVILAKLSASIIVIKTVTAVIAILKPVVYVTYTKRHYKLDGNAEPEHSTLSQRWNGMVHHFAYYVHRNTDILLLSVFVGTTSVSIYGVYLAIVSGIEKVINSIAASLNASIGNVLASGDKKTIDKAVDCFELVQVMIATILYTITAIMLMPFIKLYTAKMTDANYMQAAFGYILIIAEAFYCFRCVYSSISTNGNKFKETQMGAILESALNLGVSLVLILTLSDESSKLIAIAIGTFVGMLARLIYEIRFLSKGLIFRPVTKAIRTIGICLCASALSILTCKIIIDYQCASVIEWILKAIATAVIVALETSGICYLLMRSTMKNIIERLLHR